MGVIGKLNKTKNDIKKPIPHFDPPKITPPVFQRFEPPKIVIPVIQAPKIDIPKMDIPKIDMPTIPKIDIPEVPKIELPKIDIPKIEVPIFPDIVHNIPIISIPKLNKLPVMKTTVTRYAPGRKMEETYENDIIPEINKVENSPSIQLIAFGGIMILLILSNAIM